MSFFKRLFSGASTPEQETFPGSQVGHQVKRLAEKGASEGWDPVGSIRIRCSACSAAVRLTLGPSFLGANLCFHPSDGSLKNLTDPLSCEKCGAASFDVQVGRKSFKDVFREAVDGRPPCQQDPAKGFRCDETGNLIPDHGFTPRQDFDELWSRISRWVGERWGINDGFSFNYITDGNRQTRYIESVAGVCHYNKDQDCLVAVFRDTAGRYWYYHERR